MSDFYIKSTTEVSVERVSDVLCGALEGGSNYWRDSQTTSFEQAPEGVEWAHEAIAHGANFVVYHNDECTVVENSLERIRDALQMMAECCPFEFGNLVSERDDAETSDYLFQLICFGEVVYG